MYVSLFPTAEEAQFLPGFLPNPLPGLPFTLETPLERALAATPQWLTGVNWIAFQDEHPQGKVANHIRDVLGAIDQSGDTEERPRLRIIALLHDTFKYQSASPQSRGEQKPHGYWARQFAERYIADEGILIVLELHDEAFMASLLITRHGDREAASLRAQELIVRLGPHLPLFMRFYRCDRQQSDESIAHYEWFKAVIRTQGLADRLEA